jgi:hypothetical protein
MLYPILPNHIEKVTTMRYLTPVFAAALMVAAPSAHAFTFGNGNQGTPGSSGGSLTSPGSSLTSPGGAPGGTLATPEDQAKNFGTGATGSQDGGLSFRFGSGPFGSSANQNLAPPAWSTNPLFLDRGTSQ